MHFWRNWPISSLLDIIDPHCKYPERCANTADLERKTRLDTQSFQFAPKRKCGNNGFQTGRDPSLQGGGSRSGSIFPLWQSFNFCSYQVLRIACYRFSLTSKVCSRQKVHDRRDGIPRLDLTLCGSQGLALRRRRTHLSRLGRHLPCTSAHWWELQPLKPARTHFGVSTQQQPPWHTRVAETTTVRKIWIIECQDVDSPSI